MITKNTQYKLFLIVFIYSVLICMYNTFNKLKFIEFKSDDKKSIDEIYKKINTNIDTDRNSTHFWNENIDNDIKKYILKINEQILNKLGTEYRYIPSMTELYYSSKKNENSDRQYVDNHMDGMFYACNFYRVLVIINGNKNIDTHFPDLNKTINLQKYDIVLFDYNNELHYIDTNDKPIDNSQRIVVKLHYVKSDNRLCEKIHCEFGRQTRNIFELNKKKIYLSGIIARSSLYYNTNRKYILFIIFILLMQYRSKNAHYTSRYILYAFTFIELIGIIYTLHFNFLNSQVCK